MDVLSQSTEFNIWETIISPVWKYIHLESD
jgi:hypothetical protein